MTLPNFPTPLVPDARRPGENGHIRVTGLQLVSVATLPTQGADDQLIMLQGEPDKIYRWYNGAWVTAGGLSPGVTFNQATPSGLWTINHTLPFYPNVRVVDLTGTEVIGEVTWPLLSQVQIAFLLPVAGNAYLS